MRRFLLCALLLFTWTSSFAQQTEPAEPRKVELYLEKSKSQKATAHILMVIGVATLTITTITAVADGAQDLGNVFTGETLENQHRTYLVPTTIGAASIAGSIILYSAAARNKRRALQASTHLKLEQYPEGYQHLFTSTAYPALALKIKL